MKKPNYYEEIHEKDKESDRKWRQADRETSTEDRKRFMIDRIVKLRGKNDNDA